MPTCHVCGQEFPYGPQGIVAHSRHVDEHYGVNNQSEKDAMFQTGEPMDLAMQLLKMPIIPNSIQQDGNTYRASFKDPVSGEKLPMRAEYKESDYDPQRDELHAQIGEGENRGIDAPNIGSESPARSHVGFKTAWGDEEEIEALEDSLSADEDLPMMGRQLTTEEPYRRRGYATALYELAALAAKNKNRRIMPSFDLTNEGEKFWGDKAEWPVKTGEPMDLAMRLLKEARPHALIPNFDLRHMLNPKSDIQEQLIMQHVPHALSNAESATEVYNQLMEEAKVRDEETDYFPLPQTQIEDYGEQHPPVFRYNATNAVTYRPDFQDIQTGEPMDLAMQLLKISADEIDDIEREIEGSVKDSRRTFPKGRKKTRSMGMGSSEEEWGNRERPNARQGRKPLSFEQQESEWDKLDMHPGSRGHEINALRSEQARGYPPEFGTFADLDDGDYLLQEYNPNIEEDPYWSSFIYPGAKTRYNVPNNDYWIKDDKILNFPQRTESLEEVPTFSQTPFNPMTDFTRSEPMDLAMRLLKEDSNGQMIAADLFDNLLEEDDLMHYDEMTDRQRAIIDKKMSLMPHLFTEGSEMGENMNRYLFSRSMHESIPDHYYEDELEYLNHYKDAMNTLFPNNMHDHDKTMEIMNNGDEDHPEHPHAVALSQMYPGFNKREEEVSNIYTPDDTWRSTIETGEPMDLAWRLLKDARPHALMSHKELQSKLKEKRNMFRMISDDPSNKYAELMNEVMLREGEKVRFPIPKIENKNDGTKDITYPYADSTGMTFDTDFQDKLASEPMDLAMRLLKEQTSILTGKPHNLLDFDALMAHHDKEANVQNRRINPDFSNVSVRKVPPNISGQKRQYRHGQGDYSDITDVYEPYMTDTGERLGEMTLYDDNKVGVSSIDSDVRRQGLYDKLFRTALQDKGSLSSLDRTGQMSNPFHQKLQQTLPQSMSSTDPQGIIDYAVPTPPENWGDLQYDVGALPLQQQVQTGEPMDIAMRLLKLELAPPMTQGVEEQVPMQEDIPMVDMTMGDYESPCECAERIRSEVLERLLQMIEEPTSSQSDIDSLRNSYQEWQGHACQEILEWADGSAYWGEYCNNNMSEADQMKYTGEPMDLAWRLLKMPVVDTDIPELRMAYDFDDEVSEARQSHPQGIIGNSPLISNRQDEISDMTPNQYFDLLNQFFIQEHGKRLPDKDADYRWANMRMGAETPKEHIGNMVQGIGEGQVMGMPSLYLENDGRGNFFPTGQQEGGHRMEALRQMGHGDTPVPVLQQKRGYNKGEPMDLAWRLLKMPLYERGEKAPKTWNQQTHPQEGVLDDFLHDLSNTKEGDIGWTSEPDDARGSATKEGLIHAFGIPHQLQGQGLGRERLLEMIAEIQARYPNFKPYVSRDEILGEGNAHQFWSQMEDEGHVGVSEGEQ